MTATSPISREGDSYERIILRVVTPDGRTNEVTFRGIGEPVSIEAP